jgi:hypothetical protein
MSATAIINTLPINTDANVDVPIDELDRALQNLEVKQRKPRKTKQRDPNAPKRPASAYMLWLNDNRAAIKAVLITTNPDAKITDVTKRAGELWKLLTDDEKSPFQTASELLRAKYHDAMKIYKPNHVQAKHNKHPKFDVDATPDAPDGWSGPFDMKYLYRKVKALDGKHVRIQKSFDDAVALANNIVSAWNDAKNQDNMPSHWEHDVRPCAGITKTSTGFDLRLGPHLMTTADKDKKGGMASWIIGEYNHDNDNDADTTDEPPKKKRGRKPKTQTQSEPKPKTQSEPKTEPEVPTVDDAEPQLTSEVPTVDDAEPQLTSEVPTVEEPKPDTKAELTPEPEPEPEPEVPTVEETKPDNKSKKIIKKMTKKKNTPVDIDDCQEIELERDGQDVLLLLHEDSGKVYHPDNLSSPIGKADDEGIEFF